MWEEIVSVAVNYGLMSALFVGLLIWVLRDSKAREAKYQAMVNKLHDALSVVHDIQKETKEIHALIKKEVSGQGEKVVKKDLGGN